MGTEYSDIEHLAGLDHVRHRSGMYVGDTQHNTHTSALINILAEVTGNSADEFENGNCSRIRVCLWTQTNAVEVCDNGRGIPFGPKEIVNDLAAPVGGIPQMVVKDKLELAVGVLNSGAKYTKGVGKSFRFSAGLNGVGLKAVNALSSQFAAYTIREDGCRCIKYQSGKITTPVSEFRIESTRQWLGETGTLIEWVIDQSILPFTYNPDHIRHHLQRRAWLYQGLDLEFILDNNRPERFYAPDGLEAYLSNELGDTKPLLRFPLLKGENGVGHISADGTQSEFTYEIALAATTAQTETILPYVNGGAIEITSTPAVALRQAFARACASYLKDHYTLPKRYAKIEVKPDDFRSGLTAILKLRHTDPQFDSQTKTKMSNTDVAAALLENLPGQLLAVLLKEPIASGKLIQQALTTAEAREAAAKARAKVFSNAPSLSATDISLDVYSPPLNPDPTKARLYFSEGQSAADSLVYAAKAIDPLTKRQYKQHVGNLALRGMVFNSQATTLASAMNNRELRTIVAVAGLSLADPNDLSGCKFAEFLIMTDMDAGGHQIATLITSFFLTHFPAVIKSGRLGRVITPLFEVIDLHTKDTAFLYPEEARTPAALATRITALGYSPADVNRRFTIKRNKGLGELSDLAKMTLVENPRITRYHAPTDADITKMRHLYRVFSGADTIEQRRDLIFKLGLTAADAELIPT